MEAVRVIWTDERMDDLNHRVDEGFNRTEREFQAVRLEMRTEFTAVRSEMRTEFATVRAEMKEEFGSLRGEINGVRDEVNDLRGELNGVRGEVNGVRGEIAALNRTLIQVAFGFVAALFTGFAAVIAAVLTQS